MSFSMTGATDHGENTGDVVRLKLPMQIVPSRRWIEVLLRDFDPMLGDAAGEAIRWTLPEVIATDERRYDRIRTHISRLHVNYVLEGNQIYETEIAEAIEDTALERRIGSEEPVNPVIELLAVFDHNYSIAREAFDTHPMWERNLAFARALLVAMVWLP